MRRNFPAGWNEVHFVGQTIRLTLPGWKAGAWVAGLIFALAAAAHAQRTPVLAELFTSEGCSSCPPADVLLQNLDLRQPVAGAHILVLSEHVDYWNQLGWRDPFSSAQFTQRQERYSRALGAELFTPQLVVDGREQVLGNDRKAVQDAITRAASRTKFPIHIADV